MWIYYTARGDLRRGTQLAETLQAKLDDAPGLKRGTAATMGILAGFRGDFRTARETLERRRPVWKMARRHDIRTYYGPNDPIGGMYSLLAFARFVQGDLRGAETALTQHGGEEPRGQAFRMAHSACATGARSRRWSHRGREPGPRHRARDRIQSWQGNTSSTSG